MVHGSEDYTKKVYIYYGFGLKDKLPVYEVAPWTGQYHASPADMTEDEWRAALVDIKGRLIVVPYTSASAPTYVDLIDKAARLVGIIYGDKGQLAQYASDKAALVREQGTVTVQATDLDIRNLGSSDVPDLSDRAARLLGKITYYDTLINGSIDASTESVELSCGGIGSVGLQITGTWVGNLEFDGTIDGTNWVQIRAVQFGGTLVGGTTVNGIFFMQAGGLLKIRVYATAWTSGTAVIYMEGTVATNAVTLANALPTGTNTIGAVTATDLDIRDLTATDIVTAQLSKWGGTALTGRDVTGDLKALSDALATNRFRIDPTYWGGTALTGRDVSLDLKNLTDAFLTDAFRSNLKYVGGTAQTGRDLSLDLRELSSDSEKGVLRSIGDTGDAPTNAQGLTLLKLLTDIRTSLGATDKVFNIESVVIKRASNLNPSAGDVGLNSESPPAGKIWVITTAAAWNATSTCTRIDLLVTDSVVYPPVAQLVSPAAMRYCMAVNPAILNSSMYMRGWFVGVTAGDDLYLDINGYQMDA